MKGLRKHLEIKVVPSAMIFKSHSNDVPKLVFLVREGFNSATKLTVATVEKVHDNYDRYS